MTSISTEMNDSIEVIPSTFEDDILYDILHDDDDDDDSDDDSDYEIKAFISIQDFIIEVSTK